MNKPNKKFKDKFFSFADNNKILFIVLVLIVGMSIASSEFLTYKNIINVIRQICISAIIGLGFTVVMSSGNMDLSVGSMLGLIGICMGKLIMAGVNIFLCILFALAFGALLGWFNGLLITKLHLNGFITTLATQLIFKGANYLICRNASIGPMPQNIKFFGQGFIFGFFPVPILIMLLVAFGIYILLKFTKLGRNLLAVGGNPLAARAAGINNEKISRYAYIINGLCVAIAAIVMTGRLGSAQTTAGQGMELDAIAAVILGGTSMFGGKAHIAGAVLGCLAVGIINNGLNLAHVDANWQIVAKGLLIVVAIVMDTQSARVLQNRQKRAAK